jgi:hypothetical protein
LEGQVMSDLVIKYYSIHHRGMELVSLLQIMVSFQRPK